MSAIAACAAIKYKDYLTKRDKQNLTPGDFRGGGTCGREYLQKIIQLQFDLPMYSPLAIQGLMEQWTKERRQNARVCRRGIGDYGDESLMPPAAFGVALDDWIMNDESSTRQSRRRLLLAKEISLPWRKRFWIC